MEYRQRFHVDSISNQTVSLHPEANSESSNPLGSGFDIVQVTFVHTGSVTPPSSFWSSAAACGKFEVVVRRLT